MMARRSTHLLVIGDSIGLVWVLKNSRMAFPPGRGGQARKLEPGDELLLYTTRGCFHNPTRDRGQVVGEMTVLSAPATLERPLELAGRTFTVSCELQFKSLAPRGEGVELAPLVDDLRTFPDPRSWSALMRRPLVPLDDADAVWLRSLLRPRVARKPHAAISTYVAALPRSRVA